MVKWLIVLFIFFSSLGFSEDKSGLGLGLDLVGSTTTSNLFNFDYYNLGYLGNLNYYFNGNVLELSGGVVQNNDSTASVLLLVAYYRKLAFLQVGFTAGEFRNTTTKDSNFGIGPRVGIEFPAGEVYFRINAEYFFYSEYEKIRCCNCG